MPTEGQCLLYLAGEGIHEVTTWLSTDDRPAWMKRPQEGRGRVGGQRK